MSPFPADCGALARSNPTGALGTAAHLRVPGLLTLRWNSPGVQGLSWGQGEDCRVRRFRRRGRRKRNAPEKLGDKEEGRHDRAKNKKQGNSNPQQKVKLQQPKVGLCF